jgi:hypothetical protein
MSDADLNAQPPGGHDVASDACLRCGSRMEVVGVEELRTGGSTGVAKFFLGEWGEIGEGKLELEMSVCPACRHVEFRAPG